MIDFWDVKSKRHAQVKEDLELNIGLDNVVISVITLLELLMGARNKTEENLIRKKLHRFNVALINDKISLKAIELFEKYRLSHGLEIPDCMIASTAINANIELFTFNLKDYTFIAEISLYNHG